MAARTGAVVGHPSPCAIRPLLPEEATLTTDKTEETATAKAVVVSLVRGMSRLDRAAGTDESTNLLLDTTRGVRKRHQGLDTSARQMSPHAPPKPST